MLGVAEVIRNRCRMHYASDGSVASTVLWPLQFSGWNAKDGNRIVSARLDDLDPVVVQCQEAWRMAQAGSNTVLNAVLYCNDALVSPSWLARSRATAVIGHHTFYVPL
jgi:spore germination cell wall hydrolase CwlJ-like protein